MPRKKDPDKDEYGFKCGLANALLVPGLQDAIVPKSRSCLSNLSSPFTLYESPFASSSSRRSSSSNPTGTNKTFYLRCAFVGISDRHDPEIDETWRLYKDYLPEIPRPRGESHWTRR